MKQKVADHPSTTLNDRDIDANTIEQCQWNHRAQIADVIEELDGDWLHAYVETVVENTRASEDEWPVTSILTLAVLGGLHVQVITSLHRVSHQARRVVDDARP